MTRLLRRVNLAGVLIVLIVGGAAFSAWQRFDWSVVPATLRNLTLDPQTVRLADGTTGSILGTYQVPGSSTALLVEHRLSVWYRDLTIEERAAGRTNDVVVELLAGNTCDLVSRQRVDHRDPRIDIMDEGLGTVFDDRSPTIAHASEVADPCSGRASAPSAEVANQTIDPIVLANGLSVPACAVRVFRPGDVTSPARIGQAGIRVRVPSVDAQDERWPIERRVIVIAPDGVFDESNGAFGQLDPASCDGHVPPEAVVPG